MTDEGTKIRWAPLESNPDVFNGYLGKLGVHANWVLILNLFKIFLKINFKAI